MSTTTKLMTAEELLRMPSGNFRCELIEGKLQRFPLAEQLHGQIAAKLGCTLGNFIVANKLGEIYAAGTGFLLRRNPDTVRAADVSFLRKERVDEIGDAEGFVPGAPDLAVEVISPNDKLTEIEEKVAEWLHYGTRLVWIVNPKRRTVTDYQRSNQITRLAEAD
nr:Uma2 family endonuclease [Pyrinomonadaceae bacterium]